MDPQSPGRRPRRWRPALAAATLALLAGLGVAAWLAARPSTAVVDLEGRPRDPLAADTGRPVVLVFTRSDCPVANRYAPQVQHLADAFAPRGVDFFLVYVDPDETLDTIRRHRADYGYTLPAVRDQRHDLVRRAGARVTPEAAVFDAARRLVYLGRIDNRYADYDRKRPAATRRDLQEALEALLAGAPPPARRTQAVGCHIADLL